MIPQSALPIIGLNRPGIPASIARTATGIAWVDFSTNGWAGCTPIEANKGARSGCSICYAKTFSERKTDWNVRWGAGEQRHRFAGWSDRVQRLDKVAQRTGHHFSVFTLSLGDWLDPEVDASWLEHMLETIEGAPHLNWLLLTHRPHLARKLLPQAWIDKPPANVWFGVTLDHSAHARRWYALQETWGHTNRLWVSAEPLASSLASVDLSAARTLIAGGASNTKDPDWALDPLWIEELIERYSATLFFKQWGVFRNGKTYGDKKLAGRDFNGSTFDQTAWPLHRQLLIEASFRAEPAVV